MMALALSAALPAGAEEGKAPMPQTRGMQGMDPSMHDRPAEKAQKDCKPSSENQAEMKKHPMPETRGMQGMDPKSHEMECLEEQTAKPDGKPQHRHKAPGTGS